MKKYLLSTLAACTLAAAVHADSPTSHNVVFTCPEVNAVSHFGDYLAAYGYEWIMGNSVPVYFKSIAWPAGVPNDLSSYSSTGTSYNSITAYVNCSYTSNDVNNSPFDLSYYVTNGKGGLITGQNSNSINLQLPVGLK